MFDYLLSEPLQDTHNPHDTCSTTTNNSFIKVNNTTATIDRFREWECAFQWPKALFYFTFRNAIGTVPHVGLNPSAVNATISGTSPTLWYIIALIRFRLPFRNRAVHPSHGLLIPGSDIQLFWFCHWFQFVIL